MKDNFIYDLFRSVYRYFIKANKPVAHFVERISTTDLQNVSESVRLRLASLLEQRSHYAGQKKYPLILKEGDTNTNLQMAKLLAGSQRQDLYRVNLSKVVSKYIGETEKNLTALFDKAEEKNWILFFDEADALFGKRTDIKDAHDRYANISTAYFLQRIEEFKGTLLINCITEECRKWKALDQK